MLYPLNMFFARLITILSNTLSGSDVGSDNSGRKFLRTLTTLNFTDEGQRYNDVAKRILALSLRISCILLTCTIPLWFKSSLGISYAFTLSLMWVFSLFGTRQVQTYGFLAVVYTVALVNYFTSTTYTYMLLFMLFVVLASIIGGYKISVISTSWVLLTYFILTLFFGINYSSVIGATIITMMASLFVSLIARSVQTTLQEQLLLTDSLKQTSDKLNETLDELRLALDREEEVNQIRSDLISVISYEFFTPMSVIKMSSKMAMRKHKGGQLTVDQSQMYYGEIEENIGRLTELINIMINNKPQTNDELNGLVEQIKGEIWMM